MATFIGFNIRSKNLGFQIAITVLFYIRLWLGLRQIASFNIRACTFNVAIRFNYWISFGWV